MGWLIFIVIAVIFVVYLFKADEIRARRYKKKRRNAIDKTEAGMNRTNLRHAIYDYVTQRGGLGYIYTDYLYRNTSDCFHYYAPDGKQYDFIYRKHGYDNVSADAAQDLFERLAEELGGVYYPSTDSTPYGGGGDSGYMMYGDVSGDVHFVPGSSGGGSSKTTLRNIGVYTHEGWKKRQELWREEDEEKNKYKKV